MTHTTPPLSYQLALKIVRDAKDALTVVAQRDPSLHRQLVRALASVALNITESQSRAGRDRIHLLRVAYGSLREVNAAFDVAAAFGRLANAPSGADRDQLGALLYGSIRK